MQATIARSSWFGVLRNRPLLTLMLGHFTVDAYVGVIPVLYPLLIDRFTLDLKTVGLVTFAYTGTASLVQPFFGWVADRYGTRLIGLALIWTAVMFATIGFAPTFPILVLLAAAAGVGSGAYHPFGALSANAVIADHQRNTAMSIYVTGGTLGVALGPLIGITLFSFFGISGTALMFLPGAGAALWLLWELRTLARRGVPHHTLPRRAHRPIPLVPILAILGTMMTYTWTLYGFEAFIPTWYATLGYPPAFYGALATVVLLSSAAGAVISGTLADRYGRRTVTIGSLLLTIPSILLFTQFIGPIAFVTAALFGLSSAAIGPLMLVTAQQIMSSRAGMASGLILGLGFIAGAIGVPIIGAIADVVGIQNALRLQIFVVMATLALAWHLPSEQKLRELVE